MRIQIPAQTSFLGMAPRIAPRALPNDMATEATNARLITGDLQAWKGWAGEFQITKIGPINTIYRMHALHDGQPIWLSWNDSELGAGAVEVDVARGPIPGDTEERTYLTGLDVPRFTTIDMATDGSGTEYPYVTHRLGVPAPDQAPQVAIEIQQDSNSSTGQPNTFNFVDAGGNFSQYTASTNVPGAGPGGFDIYAGDGVPLGYPAGDYILSAYSATTLSYMAINGNLANASAFTLKTDFRIVQNSLLIRLLTDSAGSGPCIRITGAGYNSVQFSNIDSFSSYPVSEYATFPWTFSTSTDYRITITGTSEGGSTYGCHITITTVADPSTILFEQTVNIVGQGGYFGYVAFAYLGPAVVDIENTDLTAAVASNAGTLLLAATNYVFTWVNDFAEEGPPSPVSATLVRVDGTSIIITTETDSSTSFPDDYNILTKRIYRAVTGASGTSYQFVAEIDVDQPNYIDMLTDAELGEALQSDTWDLPPSDLRGILALPNGLLVGFSKNQVCFSETNRPHAWPVGYRLNVDTDIVGLGAIDTNVIVLTQSFPYIATGSSPANYSLSKLESPQACVSKRSIAYIRTVGVVYASPDGLFAVSAVGQIANLTEILFDRLAWQALSPTTLNASQHDDRYIAFYDNGQKAGLILDSKQTGFGLIDLDVWATAVYSDPFTDLYYRIDDGSDSEIYAFDSGDLMTYDWTSKLFLLPYPTSFGCAQIKAADYEDLTVRFIGDGDVFYEKIITSQKEFVLPPTVMTKFQVQFTGTSRVQEFQIAQEMDELQ